VEAVGMERIGEVEPTVPLLGSRVRRGRPVRLGGAS
jgi:hypothetical protein